MSEEPVKKTRRKSPYRAAFCKLLSFETSFTIDDLMTLAESGTKATAKTQCALLLKQDVLVRHDDGSFSRGPKHRQYRRQKTKTHVGGNSKNYLRKKAVLDDLAQKEWRELMMAKNGGVEPKPIVDPGLPPIEGFGEQGLQASTVAKMLDIHPQTARRWMHSGKISSFRLPNGSLRARLMSVMEIING